MLLAADLILLIACVLSFYNIWKDKKNCTFIYQWTFFIYAFVWEDLFIFTLFFAGLINASVFMHDIRIAFLGMLIFYCVRSGGETLYYFLQQFFQPTHHPHDIRSHLKSVQKIFGPISYQKSLIIMQVIQQITLVTSLTLLTLLLLNWKSIPTLL